MKRRIFRNLFAPFVLGGIAAATAAPPPPAPEEIDMSILEMGASEEERMIYGEPAAPQTGNENPEDLLGSSPLAPPAKTNGKKTAELPKALPAAPGSEPPPPAAADLPPLPATDETRTMSDADPLVDASGDQPEETTDPGALDSVLAPSEAVAEENALPAAEPAADGRSARKWDRTIPLYDRENPSWGVDIHGSLNALGSTSPADPNSDEEYDTRNFGLGFEWQPKFLQPLGVFSFGPSFNLYILEPMGVLTDGPFSIMSFGMSFKYQFRYFRAQPIVPFIGFEVQQMRYRFADPFPSGWTSTSGMTFGGMLLLNWMEPSAAHSLWSDTGIKRSYLVGEVKTMTAGEPALSVDGSAIYFGLRVEY